MGILNLGSPIGDPPLGDLPLGIPHWGSPIGRSPLADPQLVAVKDPGVEVSTKSHTRHRKEGRKEGRIGYECCVESKQIRRVPKKIKK